MLKDRTAELSFDEVTPKLGEELVGGSRIVVVKGVLPLDMQKGVAQAYHASRRKVLWSHRIPSRVLANLGLGDTRLYRRVRAGDVKADPRDLSEHMLCASGAIASLQSVHDQVARLEMVRSMWGESALQQNLALFALSLDGKAFPPHQDNLGKAGIAEAAQFRPTRWTIYKYSSGLPLEPDYVFDTEAGDIVILAERSGNPPAEALAFRTGEHTFYPQGSVIHSGVNLSLAPRYGLGLFNEQVPEVEV